MLLLLPACAILELLGFLVRLLHRLAYFSFLLARLDGDGEVACCAVLRRFADGAFRFLPLVCAGADFVSVMTMLV
jgi:hypothetical protein